MSGCDLCWRVDVYSDVQTVWPMPVQAHKRPRWPPGNIACCSTAPHSYALIRASCNLCHVNIMHTASAAPFYIRRSCVICLQVRLRLRPAVSRRWTRQVWLPSWLPGRSWQCVWAHQAVRPAGQSRRLETATSTSSSSCRCEEGQRFLDAFCAETVSSKGGHGLLAKVHCIRAGCNMQVHCFCGLGQQIVTHVRFAMMLSVPAAVPAAPFCFCRVPQAVCA